MAERGLDLALVDPAPALAIIREEGASAHLSSRQEEPSLQWKPGGQLGLREAGSTKLTPAAAVRAVQHAPTTEVSPATLQRQQCAVGVSSAPGTG